MEDWRKNWPSLEQQIVVLPLCVAHEILVESALTLLPTLADKEEIRMAWWSGQKNANDFCANMAQTE